VNGKRALFDSNTIIYLAKREIPFKFLERFDEQYISVITYMEVLGYEFHYVKDEKFVKELLGLFKMIYINKRIADIVIETRKKKRIKIPDAIISATAVSENLILVTRNIDDFKNTGAEVLDPIG